MNEKG